MSRLQPNVHVFVSAAVLAVQSMPCIHGTLESLDLLQRTDLIRSTLLDVPGNLTRRGCRTLECFDQILKCHSADVINECLAARDMARLLKRAELKLENRYKPRSSAWVFKRPWKRRKELV